MLADKVTDAECARRGVSRVRGRYRKALELRVAGFASDLGVLIDNRSSDVIMLTT